MEDDNEEQALQGAFTIALTDRGDYLLAASNLVEGLDELTRRKYCEAAIRIATDPVSSEFDDSQAVFAHRLGAVRMSFDNGSTPTKALYLAACLAVDEEQHVRIPAEPHSGRR